MSNSQDKRTLIDPKFKKLPIIRQCEILGLSRSTYYYRKITESPLNLMLMNRIDELYTEHPALGSRQMTASLNLEGHRVNRKRIQRLMQLMRIEAIYPKKNTSIPDINHEIYPYLLRNITIQRPLQVCSMDITYIRMEGGFLYLTAVIDWYSRFVLSWEISNTLSNDFCIEALISAFRFGIPEIFNTDQGSQFTSSDFIQELKSRKIKISMDGRKRALDNIFIERLWRTIKYEEIYLKNYKTGKDVFDGIKNYLNYYNYKRPHSALNGKTPSSFFENK